MPSWWLIFFRAHLTGMHDIVFGDATWIAIMGVGRNHHEIQIEVGPPA
jgi:hypothetical protein